MNFANPSHALAHHVSGAIARGEAQAIVGIPATPAPPPCTLAGPYDDRTDAEALADARYMAAHKRANPHNWPRVPGWPALSSHFVCKRDAQAQGRAAAIGAPLPGNVRPGSAWADWFAQGNGPFRDIETGGE